MMGDTMTYRPSLLDERPPLPRNLDEYRVWYHTRLPELRTELARSQANLRWIAEGHYKNPRARPPFARPR
jgi:hypothetical protein